MLSRVVIRRSLAGSAVLAAVLVITSCSGTSSRRPTAVLDNIRTTATFPVRSFSMFGGGQSSGLPSEERACRQRLKRLGATFSEVPAISEGGGCGIAYPVEMTALSGGIQLSTPAVLNCAMAESFARWVKSDLAPQSRLRYFSGVRKLHIASTYSCRWIKGRVGGNLSEHAKGNAVDLAGFTLDSGKYIDVKKPGFFAFRERGLLNNVRGEACDYFTTVLGPGYDADHKDHFHFDMRPRGGGYRTCK
jgi:hypothetical protein